MTTTMAKYQAHKLGDRMPENSSGDGLWHGVYVREVIEQGPAGSKAGRTKDVMKVRWTSASGEVTDGCLR